MARDNDFRIPRRILRRMPATVTVRRPPYARAIGAAAIAALACGAIAIGVIGIGRLAVGSLLVGRTRFKRVDIDELRVRRLIAPTNSKLH